MEEVGRWGPLEVTGGHWRLSTLSSRLLLPCSLVPAWDADHTKVLCTHSRTALFPACLSSYWIQIHKLVGVSVCVVYAFVYLCV